MPLVNVRLIEGVFNEDEKRAMIEKLTDAMVEIEGENMRQVTWVVIDEVKSGDWGLAGNAAHHRARPRHQEQRSRLTMAIADAVDAGPSRARSRAERLCRRRRRPHRLRGLHQPSRRARAAQGEQTLLLLPPWAIVHSRFWKLQVPYLARHFRVITFDPRGNGASDRPASHRRLRPARCSRATRSRCWTPPAPSTAWPSIHCGSAQAGLLFATEQRRPRARRAVLLAGAADQPAAARAHRPLLRRAARRLRGLGEDQPPLLGTGLQAASSSSSSRSASPRRTAPSSSRTRSPGAWRPIPRRSCTR